MATVTVEILRCPHGALAVSLAGKPTDGGKRITPGKCCGSWTTIGSWQVDADQIRADLDSEEVIAAKPDAPYVSAADRCRAALKAAGWSARQVTVRDIGGSLDSSLIVTVRDHRLDLDPVRAVAKTIEVINRDSSGDILGGGNTYVRVQRAV